MRPEVSAFRELDTLVRNLTDQLAGYRRRALAAESRTRELELQAGQLERALSDSRQELSAASESREHALAAARASTAAARKARESLAQLEHAHTELERASVELFPTAALHGAHRAAGSVDPDLVAENERLRSRLAEAKERTTLISDRVRFLRQQLMTGTER